MSGDWIEQPEWRGSARVVEAIENLIKYNIGGPELTSRIHRMLVAFNYAAAEWEEVGFIVQRLENWRSNGGQWGEREEEELTRMMSELLSIKAPIPTEAEREAVKRMIGFLIDRYKAAVVMVACDAALKERQP